MIEAGLLILIVCLIAVIVCVTMRIMRRDADPIAIQFVKCSGDCGKKVMIIGRRQWFGECVWCHHCPGIDP